MKLVSSTMDVQANTVVLTVTDQFGGNQSSKAIKLEDLDNFISDLHKVRLGLAIASKPEIGMEMATQKMLQIEEEKIRSILIPDEEAVTA